MESSQGGGAGGWRAVREEGLQGREQREEGAGGGEQTGRSSDLSSLKPAECGFTVSQKEVETTTKNTQE